MNSDPRSWVSLGAEVYALAVLYFNRIHLFPVTKANRHIIQSGPFLAQVRNL